MRERVLRKVARRLSPFLGLLYFINYLDRTNIGFAAPHGMNETLGLDKAAFGLASGIFFLLATCYLKCQVIWSCTKSVHGDGLPVLW